MRALYKRLGIESGLTTAYHPKGNGKVEHKNQHVESVMEQGLDVYRGEERWRASGGEVDGGSVERTQEPLCARGKSGPIRQDILARELVQNEGLPGPI